MFDSPGICVTCGYPLVNHPRLGCAAVEGNAQLPEEDLDGEELADKRGYDLHPERDDRDESPVEMTERTLDRWDFDSDPDWR